MEYKILSIRVPVDAELFNDIFTPEENYAMLKMGREQIIKQRTENREIREKNRQKYRERLQELEKQVDAMKRELQKYGVIFTPANDITNLTVKC
jgi:Tfp pilus assembly protein PilO